MLDSGLVKRARGMTRELDAMIGAIEAEIRERVVECVANLPREIDPAIRHRERQMTDTVTISRACAERAVRAPKTGNWSALDEIADALSSPPPPSGLREALEKIAAGSDWSKWSVDSKDIGVLTTIIKAMQQIANTALASSDDGWVKVDEEHPLPDDLTWGDETLEHHAYCKSPKVVAYRRRPSAEQGG